jgi:hypothetical protein
MQSQSICVVPLAPPHFLLNASFARSAVDVSFLVCSADLWTADGTREANLVLHPSFLPPPTSPDPAYKRVRPLPNTDDTPQHYPASCHGGAPASEWAEALQPQPRPVSCKLPDDRRCSYPDWDCSPMSKPVPPQPQPQTRPRRYSSLSPPISSSFPFMSLPLPTSFIPYAVPGSTPAAGAGPGAAACIRNLVGALHVNAHALRDTQGKRAIFFVWHDLSYVSSPFLNL